jgi:hypothetical protein
MNDLLRSFGINQNVDLVLGQELYGKAREDYADNPGIFSSYERFITESREIDHKRRCVQAIGDGAISFNPVYKKIVLLAQGMLARSVVLDLGAEEFISWFIVLSVFMDKTMASAKAIQPDGFTETDLVWENGNFVIPSL